MIFLWTLLGVVFCIFMVIIIRSLSVPAAPPDAVAAVLPDISRDAIKKLSEAVTCRTVSYADYSRIDTGEYKKFHRFIEKAFPLIHKNMRKKKFNDFTLLFFLGGN